MCGVHVCCSRKHRDLSHRLSCLAAKMKRMEMQFWLWDHLSPSSVHGWNKLLSLVSLHTHSALLRRRRWCWHQDKEQLIEIFPNGWSIACVVDREKALVMPSDSIFISSGQSEFRQMNAIQTQIQGHMFYSQGSTLQATFVHSASCSESFGKSSLWQKISTSLNDLSTWSVMFFERYVQNNL